MCITYLRLQRITYINFSFISTPKMFSLVWISSAFPMCFCSLSSGLISVNHWMKSAIYQTIVWAVVGGWIRLAHSSFLNLRFQAHLRRFVLPSAWRPCCPRAVDVWAVSVAHTAGPSAVLAPCCCCFSGYCCFPASPLGCQWSILCRGLRHGYQSLPAVLSLPPCSTIWEWTTGNLWRQDCFSLTFPHSVLRWLQSLEDIVGL